jgi:hypothetical protein
MTSKCTKSNYTPEESKDNLAIIQQLMGSKLSQTCMTAYAEGKIDMVVADAQVNAGASSGCGPIAMMSNAYTDMVKNTTCMVSSLQNNIKVTVKEVNNVSFFCEYCIFEKGFKMSQTINGKINVVANLSEQVKTDIVNDIKSSIKQLQKNIQDQEQTAGAVVPGATSLQISDVSLTSYMDSTVISETVNTFATELDFTNNTVLNFRHMVFKDNYEFTQDIIIDAAVSNMVAKIFEGIIKNTKITEVVQTQSSEQKSKSLSGLQSSGMGVGVVIGIIILVLLLYYFCKNNVIYFLLVFYLFFISLLFFFLWKYSDRPELETLNGSMSLIGLNPKTAILICSIIVWSICCILFVYGTYQKIVGCKKINQVLDNVENKY